MPRVRFMLLRRRARAVLARLARPSCQGQRRGACSPPCGLIVNASGVWPNLSLNPDAPPAGARSNILARPPSRRAG